MLQTFEITRSFWINIISMSFLPGINTVGLAQHVPFPVPMPILGQTREMYNWELMCDMMMQDIRIMSSHMKMMRMECVRQRLERQQVLAQRAREQTSDKVAAPEMAEGQ